MKIAILGYGKMGKMIEEIAIARGHNIVLKISSDNLEQLTEANLKQADCVIEFSVPASALSNMELCLKAGVPVVTGTTGWHDQLDNVKQWVFEHDGSLVYGSNFSVGVNMLFGLNQLLARWMNDFPEYDIQIEEIHHTQKQDAPSGTAITLATGILENVNRLENWKRSHIEEETEFGPKSLPVYYDRQENIPGTHIVSYTSDIDRIEVTHEAFSRKGFAMGAVLAAEFIKGRKGIFTPTDIFKFTI